MVGHGRAPCEFVSPGVLKRRVGWADHGARPDTLKLNPTVKTLTRARK
jgi:hypothetical protein